MEDREEYYTPDTYTVVDREEYYTPDTYTVEDREEYYTPDTYTVEYKGGVLHTRHIHSGIQGRSTTHSCNTTLF